MSNIDLKIERKKVSDLKPADYNPRKMKKEEMAKLRKSLDTFGYVDPIIWNKRTNTVVGGHQRIKALIDLGHKDDEIAVVIVDFDLEKEKALNIALNRISGQFNKEKLGMILDKMSMEDLELTGLNGDEMAEAIDLLLEPLKDENDAPDLPLTTDVKPGDIFIMGKHRVMCGDSTKKEDVEKLMDGKKADMVFTDPPYNVNYEGSNGLTIQNDKMGDKAFYRFLLDAFMNMHLVMRAGAPIYVAHADSEGANFRNAFIDAGFLMKQCIIWVKNSIVMGRQDYHWQHEPILYGWKQGGGALLVWVPRQNHSSERCRRSGVQDGQKADARGNQEAQKREAQFCGIRGQTTEQRQAPNHEADHTGRALHQEQLHEGQHRPRSVSWKRQHFNGIRPTTAYLLWHGA